MASTGTQTTGQGRSRRSAHKTEHDESLETRVSNLENLSQPYEDYANSIKDNVELIKEINADFKHDRAEALSALNESVIAAGQQYVDKVKSVATSSVELSTSRLAITLIKRLEDGDELAEKYAERLCGLLGAKRSRDDDEQMLPTPPMESAPSAESSERASKRRRTSAVPQTPSKRPTTGSQASPALSLPSSVAGEEASAPRRTGRAHKPAKRHEDFISWGDVKKARQQRRRR